MQGVSSWTKWIALAIPLMLIGCILGMVLLFASSRPASAACNPAGPAVTVDPASLPTGPIAGFSGKQLTNAAEIMLAAQDMGLSRRDQQIGVMTAIGESTLRVLDRGDTAGPDSRGLFQQRKSWGPKSDRMDPYVSAQLFFEALIEVTNRDALEPTIAAHRVQGNRDPFHYAQHWAAAGKILSALSDVKAAGTPTVTGAGADQVTSNYDLGPVQSQAAALANTLGPMFNVKAVGGYRANDPYPDHPSGLAVDFMTDDKNTGDQLAAYAQQHAQELGIDYIIWYQRTWSADRAAEGWRDMAARGSRTADHKDHVHITLESDATAGTTAGCAALFSGAQVSQTGWTQPAEGPVTSTFGPRSAPAAGASSYHKGIDYGPGCDAPIFAVNGGEVVAAGPATGFGQWIRIDHGEGIVSTYGHMYANAMQVRVGDTVKSGQRIAAVGSAGISTGCHLHFEIARNGQAVDPIGFLQGQGLDVITSRA